MTRNGHATMSLKDADTHVMGEINHLLDAVLGSSPLYDMELQKHCIKFQVEHASSKAAFQRRSLSPMSTPATTSSVPGGEVGATSHTPPHQPPPHHALGEADASCEKDDGLPLLSPEMDHLQQALQRMIELGASVASHVLKTTTQCARAAGGQSPLSGGSFTSVVGGAGDHHRQASTSSSSSSQRGGDLSPSFASPDSAAAGSASFRASSVDDIAMDEAWMECGAHLMHCSVEIMALALLVHEGLRSRLQSFLINHLHILRYAHDALSISKEHETTYFASGFRTNVMKLIANVSYENINACDCICKDPPQSPSLSSSCASDNGGGLSLEKKSLLHQVLCSTKIDDDNPHLVEWAEFAIRNLMSCSEVGREEMKRLRAVGVEEGTRNLMQRSKVEHVLNVETGKLVTKKSAPSPQ